MDRCKVKMFVERHKKKFIIGAGVVAGVITYAIVRTSIRPSKVTSFLPIGNKIKDIAIPDDFSVGSIEALFEDGDEIVAIVQDMTVNDMGRFGEELVKYGLVANGAAAAITAEFLRSQ